jgi:hypothetical protein
MAAYSHDPDMSDAAFRAMLGKRVLGDAATEQAIDDLLALEAIFASERTWYQPSPVVSIERITSLEQAGALSNERRARYREQLGQLTAIVSRYRDAKNDGERKLFTTADWVVRQWQGDARKLLYGDESRSKCQAGAE